MKLLLPNPLLLGIEAATIRTDIKQIHTTRPILGIEFDLVFASMPRRSGLGSRSFIFFTASQN
ncbi:MAG: hypothetical protein AAFN10_29260, partial [Bacteroidota bacterium]